LLPTAAAASAASAAGVVDAIAVEKAAFDAAMQAVAASDALPDFPVVLDLARHEAEFHLAEAPAPKLPQASKSG